MSTRGTQDAGSLLEEREAETSVEGVKSEDTSFKRHKHFFGPRVYKARAVRVKKKKESDSPKRNPNKIMQLFCYNSKKKRSRSAKMEAACSDEEKDSTLQPNRDEKKGKTFTELLETHRAETTEMAIIEQETAIEKHETVKTTDVDETQDIDHKISHKDLIQIKKTPEQDLVNSERSKLWTKKIAGKNNMADLSKVRNIDKDIRKANTQALKDKPSGTAAKKGTQVNDIILKTHRIASATSTRGTQDTGSLLGEREAETSVNGIKSEDTSFQHHKYFFFGPRVYKTRTPGVKKKKESDSPKRNSHKIMQLFCYNFKKKRRRSTKMEAACSDEQKDSTLQPNRNEKKGKIFTELLETHRAETMEMAIIEQETAIEKHETVKTTDVDETQDIDHKISHKDLIQIKKTPEQDLVNSESSKLWTKRIAGKNNMADVSNVRNIDKDVRKANTQALKDKPSGTAAKKGTQVNDIILKTQREAKTSVEGVKSEKTKSSKSSYKTLSMVSAQRDFLNKSTRGLKWWEVSQEKNYRVMDREVPAKSFQYTVSPEMLKFNEMFPDVSLKSDLVEAFHDAFEFFRKDKTKRVDMNDLQYSLRMMGIHLTHQDTFEALKSADIDGDGKVNFCDFLAVLTDDQRFLITIDIRQQLPVSEQEYLDVILFDAIFRLLQKYSLPRKSTAEISNYYQDKFKAIPQLPKLKGSKSQVMVDFARGTHIMGMTNRQRVRYLDESKTIKGCCVGSPYVVIPRVPLCTKLDKKLSGRPDILRLMQKNIYTGDKETSVVDMEIDVRGMTHCGIQVDLGKKCFLERAKSHKIQGGQIDSEAYQDKWEESDAECTEVLNESSWYLSENPNVEQKPEKEDIVQE